MPLVHMNGLPIMQISYLDVNMIVNTVIAKKWQ